MGAGVCWACGGEDDVCGTCGRGMLGPLVEIGRWTTGIAIENLADARSNRRAAYQVAALLCERYADADVRVTHDPRVIVSIEAVDDEQLQDMRDAVADAAATVEAKVSK